MLLLKKINVDNSVESIIQGSGLKDEVITFEESFLISQLHDSGSEASLLTKIKRMKISLAGVTQ